MILTGIMLGLVSLHFTKCKFGRFYTFLLVNIFVIFTFKLMVFNLGYSLNGKKDLFERRSWCWGFPEDLWWKQEKWKPSPTFLQEQWGYCKTHSATIAKHEHC